MRRTAALVTLLAAATSGQASPSCVSVFTDDFEDGVLDAAYVPVGDCGTPAEPAGALVLETPAGCQGAVGVALDDQQLVLCGDFDLAIDYQLDQFVNPTGGSGAVAAGISVRTADDDEFVGTVELYSRFTVGDCSPAPRNYKAWTVSPINCDSTFVPTTADSGSLRIQREGATIRLYADDSGSWGLLVEEPTTTEDLSVLLFAGNSFDVNGTAVRVLFDNLEVNSTPSACAADCDGNGLLNVDDVDCFAASFLAGCP